MCVCVYFSIRIIYTNDMLNFQIFEIISNLFTFLVILFNEYQSFLRAGQKNFNNNNKQDSYEFLNLP